MISLLLCSVYKYFRKDLIHIFLISSSIFLQKFCLLLLCLATTRLVLPCLVLLAWFGALASIADGCANFSFGCWPFACCTRPVANLLAWAWGSWQEEPPDRNTNRRVTSNPRRFWKVQGGAHASVRNQDLPGFKHLVLCWEVVWLLFHRSGATVFKTTFCGMNTMWPQGRSPTGLRLWGVLFSFLYTASSYSCFNEYTALWNSMLQEDGHEVQLERVRFKAGKSPWVGTRSTYKKIYKFLWLGC